MGSGSNYAVTDMQLIRLPYKSILTYLCLYTIGIDCKSLFCCCYQTVPYNIKRKMSNPEIADWNNLIQKNVKTQDLKDLCNIIMVDNEFITILEGTRQEHVTPKKHIKEFIATGCIKLILKN